MSLRTFLSSLLPPILADWQLPWAARMHRQGRRGVARAVYRRILARVPRHFSVLQLMAVIELSRQRPAEALGWLERARDIRPDDPRLETQFGCALMALGRENEAEACFQRARQHPAAAVEATVNLATLYRNQRRFEACMPLYLEAARLAPRRFEPVIGLANTLVELHRIDEAVQLRGGDALQRKPPCDKPGVMLLNPPYGERIEAAGVAGRQRAITESEGDFFLQLAQHWRAHFGGWTAWVLTPDLKLPGRMRLKENRRVPLWNGPIECRLFRFQMQPPKLGSDPN